MKLQFAKLLNDVITPTKRKGDGCYDIYPHFESIEVRFEPHEIKMLPTGLVSKFSNKYRMAVRERGSNSKSGLLTVSGQIDSNYRGEMFLSLYNSNSVPLVITKAVKEVKKTKELIQVPYSKAVAQFAMERVPKCKIKISPLAKITKHKTERGDGKLGSSGK